MLSFFIYFYRMGKKYYWIPQTDRSLNDFEFFKTDILDKPVIYDSRQRIYIRTREHFPVGSIFHTLRNDYDYVVEEKKRMWGNHYIVRALCAPWSWDVANGLRDGDLIFRTGFLHGDGEG